MQRRAVTTTNSATVTRQERVSFGAILHFDMIGYFGAVPIEDHVLDNAEAASIARTPAPEALKWVADECDAIIQSGALPFRYSNENENWGRINRCCCLCIEVKSIALSCFCTEQSYK